MFGRPTQVPQTEETPFKPRSPYAVAKLFAYATVVNYREAYGMYAVNGILYNHESSRRGTSTVLCTISRPSLRSASIRIVFCLVYGYTRQSTPAGEYFVTRKISRAAAKISLGLQQVLELGNLDAKCDWGHAQVRLLRRSASHPELLLSTSSRPSVLPSSATYSVKHRAQCRGIF